MDMSVKQLMQEGVIGDVVEGVGTYLESRCVCVCGGAN